MLVWQVKVMEDWGSVFFSTAVSAAKGSTAGSGTSGMVIDDI